MMARPVCATSKEVLFYMHVIQLKKAVVLHSKDSMVGPQASSLPIHMVCIALCDPKTVLAHANTIPVCWESSVLVSRISAHMHRLVPIRDAQPHSVACQRPSATQAADVAIIMSNVILGCPRKSAHALPI